jgi:hypothetical protein
MHDGLALLYVGISPSKPPSNHQSPSKQSLAGRVRYHFAGNAGGWTLRLTLTCLLGGQLGTHFLRRSSIQAQSPWSLDETQLPGPTNCAPATGTISEAWAIQALPRLW